MGKSTGKPISILKRSHAKNLNPKPKLAKRSSNSTIDQPKSKKPKHTSGQKWHSDINFRPVNQIHYNAAFAVGRLLEADATGRRGVTLKSLTLAPHIENKKAVYAVTVETLKHVPILSRLVEATKLMELTPGLGLGAAYVLIRDVLFGQGVKPLGRAEKAVLSQSQALLAALNDLFKEQGVKTADELLAAYKTTDQNVVEHPRWVRVNTLKISMKDAIATLEKNYQVQTDDLLSEDLLKLPPNTDLHDHPLVLSGALVLQSKASCMPARALDLGSLVGKLRSNKGKSKDKSTSSIFKVLDACAAPGNKTTHLAALLHQACGDATASQPNIGKSKAKAALIPKVIAFDKDQTRLQRLKDNVSKTGASDIIEAECCDFLSVQPTDYSDVTAILLDPSCSGSGTGTSRMDYLLPSASSRPAGEDALHYTDTRVDALATFQESALRHALSFPNVQRIVYSTCSVHTRENEGVIASVLPDARKQNFELMKALPQWHRRGILGSQGLEDKETECLVRTDANEDGTDGFFVAVFERMVQ